VCRRIAATYWIEDVVHESVSNKLIPMHSLCDYWDGVIGTLVAKIVTIIAENDGGGGSSSNEENSSIPDTNEQQHPYYHFYHNDGKKSYDPKFLISVDKSVLGLYYCAKRMFFLSGPIGHARCMLLYRASTSDDHIALFLKHVLNAMHIKIAVSIMFYYIESYSRI
jgi:hypothetical protein